MSRYDLVVIGAGAAGMMCAGVAGQLGSRVLLLDHATQLGEKIRISGGGRCNFTNLHTSPANFLSQNPHFCRSALARYTPQDFLDLLRRHGVAWHEKHKGQLFCNNSAEDIIAVLRTECAAGGVTLQSGCTIQNVRRVGVNFEIDTNQGTIRSRQLVVATGGLSIPKIGATDFGYRLARQFGLPVVEPRPALVPLTFAADAWAPFVACSGIALDCNISTGKGRTKGQFREDLLLTHRGLSGPAILQISSYWQAGTNITINLLPEEDAVEWLLGEKRTTRRQLANVLAQRLPARLADAWCAAEDISGDATLTMLPDKILHRLGERLNRWELQPAGTEGYRKAEVTLGGVETRALSSSTMMAEAVPGLYFIGEVVDVTGWLGGYNFQWAWASAVAAGRAAAERCHTG